MTVTAVSLSAMGRIRILEGDQEKKLNDSWCRGTGSNRHGPFGPQDFKSFYGVFVDRGNQVQISEIAQKKGILALGSDSLFLALFWGVCHSSVTRKVCPICGLAGQVTPCPHAAGMNS